MKYILTALGIIVLLLTFTKKETPIQPLNIEETILAFGDSLTYGYNAEPSQSYPAVLGRLTGMKVINAGISAETSEDGLLRIEDVLNDSSIKLMILCFGGNDILQNKPMSRLKQNLKTMIHLAKSKNIEVLLIAVPNLHLLRLSPLTLYEEVAKEENIPLLDEMLSNILHNTTLKSDQIHPNASGYKIMADTIYTSLKTYGWIAK